MGHLDRQGHEFGGFVTGEAEHQALVTGALQVEIVDRLAVPRLPGTGDALRDIGRLVVQRDHDAARAAVDALRSRVEADRQQPIPGQLLDVDVRLGGRLTGDDDHTIGDDGLHGGMRPRIVGQHRVQHGIGDGVGDLVGMPFGNRFRGELPAHESGRIDVAERVRQ